VSYPPSPSQPPIVPGPQPEPYQAQPLQPDYLLQPVYPPQVVIAAGPPSSGAATASLSFGTIGLVGGWWVLGIPCVIAVILGHVGLKQTRNHAMSRRGQAVAELVMGYVVFVPAIVYFFLFVVGGRR
jgi:uncharacterized protein DUF4190